jgi:altronate dehydratase
VKPALVISERDNVATALERLEPGRLVQLGGLSVTVTEPVPSGHKLALRTIAAGEAVVKYGSPIGTATADIPAGTHVHIHNLASNRGRGDVDAPPVTPPPAAEPQPRLAEPPDEAAGSASDLMPKMPGR